MQRVQSAAPATLREIAAKAWGRVPIPGPKYLGGGGGVEATVGGGGVVKWNSAPPLKRKRSDNNPPPQKYPNQCGLWLRIPCCLGATLKRGDKTPLRVYQPHLGGEKKNPPKWPKKGPRGGGGARLDQTLLCGTTSRGFPDVVHQ